MTRTSKLGVLALGALGLTAVGATKQALFEAHSCQYNTYMCCWTENDGQGLGQGMQDNTDVCYVNGVAPTEQKETHCHGFTWVDGDPPEVIERLYEYVRNYDHRDQRAYYGRIDNARQCDCVEKMPIVSRADCTRINAITHKEEACLLNDLVVEYERNHPQSSLDLRPEEPQLMNPLATPGLTLCSEAQKNHNMKAMRRGNHDGPDKSQGHYQANSANDVVLTSSTSSYEPSPPSPSPDGGGDDGIAIHASATQEPVVAEHDDEAWNYNNGDGNGDGMGPRDNSEVFSWDHVAQGSIRGSAPKPASGYSSTMNNVARPSTTDSFIGATGIHPVASTTSGHLESVAHCLIEGGILDPEIDLTTAQLEMIADIIEGSSKEHLAGAGQEPDSTDDFGTDHGR